MCSGKLGHIDYGSWPEAVELLEQLALQAAQETRLSTDKADLIADEHLDTGGEKSWVPEAAGHQVKHGRQIAGVVLAMAEVGLQTGQLDLVGVKEHVLEPLAIFRR